MAEAVVDVLEAVQVQKQHGAQAAGLFAVQQGGLQAVFEQGAVGQAGEGVVVCLVVQACLSVLEAGDVGEDSDEMGDEVVLVAHGADGQPARVDVAVLAAVVDLALPVAFCSQLMPHRGIEGAVVLARGKQTGRMADGFGLAVTGDLTERAIDGMDALARVGDQHAFSGAFEHGGGQVQFFLHVLAFGDVTADGQQAVFAVDQYRVRGEFTESDVALGTPDPDPKLVNRAMALDVPDHGLTFVQVGPDAQFERGARHALFLGVAGDAGKAFVDFENHPVAHTADGQPVGGGVEGLGELFFRELQLSLSLFERGDVADHHQHSGLGAQFEGLGGHESGKGLSVLAPQGHFQIADRAFLQLLKQAGTHAGNGPDVDLRGRFANGFFGGESRLFYERFIGFQNLAIDEAGDDHDVRAVGEDGGKPVFR